MREKKASMAEYPHFFRFSGDLRIDHHAAAGSGRGVSRKMRRTPATGGFVDVVPVGFMPGCVYPLSWGDLPRSLHYPESSKHLP